MLPALMVAATAAQVAGQYMQNQAQKKANKTKARALQAQAERRLAKGKTEAELTIAQGGRDQTSLMADRLSSGSSRRALAESGALEEIASRAKFEADMVMEDAQYEAQMIREDAGATLAENKYADTATALSSAGTILSNSYQYKLARKGY